jgi:hypothetical protein
MSGVIASSERRRRRRVFRHLFDSMGQTPLFRGETLDRPIQLIEARHGARRLGSRWNFLGTSVLVELFAKPLREHASLGKLPLVAAEIALVRFLDVLRLRDLPLEIPDLFLELGAFFPQTLRLFRQGLLDAGVRRPGARGSGAQPASSSSLRASSTGGSGAADAATNR